MSAQTRGAASTLTGTVGTDAITILSGLIAGSFLRVHNPGLNTGNFLAVTYDGVTVPVVYGAGVTISPGGDDVYTTFVPTGAVQIIGSGADCAYTLMWF